MAIYHAHVKVFGRKDGVSILARAAYRSGSSLSSDELGDKYDYSRKSGVVYSAVMLPSNAPQSFADRAILWNTVEQNEKSSDARFAREYEFAIPAEIPADKRPEFITKFVQENFVDKGMCVDFSIHDPAGKNHQNPHVHILTTLRPFNSDGTFAASKAAKRSYALDENGEKIPLLDENGKQKTDKKGRKQWKRETQKCLVDWDKTDFLNTVRKNWEIHCNAVLDPAHHISCESYAKRGIDKVPTRHEGVERIIRQKNAQAKLNKNNVAYNKYVKQLNHDLDVIVQQKADLIRSMTAPQKYERRYNSYGTRFERSYRKNYNKQSGNNDAIAQLLQQELVQSVRTGGVDTTEQYNSGSVSGNSFRDHELQREEHSKRQSVSLSNRVQPLRTETTRTTAKRSVIFAEKDFSKWLSLEQFASLDRVKSALEHHSRGLSRTEYAERVKLQRAVAQAATEPAKFVEIDNHLEYGTIAKSTYINVGDRISGIDYRTNEPYQLTVAHDADGLYMYDVDDDYNVDDAIAFLNDQISHGNSVKIDRPTQRRSPRTDHR